MGGQAPQPVRGPVGADLEADQAGRVDHPALDPEEGVGAISPSRNDGENLRLSPLEPSKGVLNRIDRLIHHDQPLVDPLRDYWHPRFTHSFAVTIL